MIRGLRFALPVGMNIWIGTNKKHSEKNFSECFYEINLWIALAPGGRSRGNAG